jgi:hypothetical protein
VSPGTESHLREEIVRFAFAMEEPEETAKLHLRLRGLNPRPLNPARISDLAAAFDLDLAGDG